MGSLISKPKALAAPKPIIITSPAPQPAAIAPPNETASEDAAGDISAASDTENDSVTHTQDSEVRSANLLRRSRGRGSTILTSFRGVLNKRRLDSPRKTLLGE